VLDNPALSAALLLIKKRQIINAHKIYID
jgi:hypothetical protein